MTLQLKIIVALFSESAWLSRPPTKIRMQITTDRGNRCEENAQMNELRNWNEEHAN